MSLPALRQPKTLSFLNKPKQKVIVPDFDAQHVILTLKDATKLVISSDAYNGVVTIEEKYKCIFCAVEIELDTNLKKLHLCSASHRKVLGCYPFLEEFGANMIRTIENVIDRLLTSKRFQALIDQVTNTAIDKIMNVSRNNGDRLGRNFDNSNIKNYDRKLEKQRAKEKDNNDNVTETLSYTYDDDSALGKINLNALMKKEALLPFKEISLQYKRFTKTLSKNGKLTKTSSNPQEKNNYNVNSKIMVTNLPEPVNNFREKIKINGRFRNDPNEKSIEEFIDKAKNDGNESRTPEDVQSENDNTSLSTENANFVSVEVDTDDHELKHDSHETEKNSGSVQNKSQNEESSHDQYDEIAKREENIENHKFSDENGYQARDKIQVSSSQNDEREIARMLGEYHENERADVVINPVANANVFKSIEIKSEIVNSTVETKTTSYENNEETNVDHVMSPKLKPKAFSYHKIEQPSHEKTFSENEVNSITEANNMDSGEFKDLTGTNMKSKNKLSPYSAQYKTIRKEGNKLYAYENSPDYKEYHEMLKKQSKFENAKPIY